MNSMRFSAICLCITTMFGFIQATTDSTQGFDFLLTKLTYEQQQSYLEIIGFSLAAKELDNRVINSFDINSDGNLLLGFEGGGVNIYDKKGNYKLSYDFHITGASVALWENDHIQIFIARGNNILDISNGRATVYKISDDDRRYGYRSDVLKMSPQKTLYHEGYAYTVQNLRGFGSFLKGGTSLTMTNGQEETKLIYSAEVASLRSLAIVVITLLLLALTFSYVIARLKKKGMQSSS